MEIVHLYSLPNCKIDDSPLCGAKDYAVYPAENWHSAEAKGATGLSRMNSPTKDKKPFKQVCKKCISSAYYKAL